MKFDFGFKDLVYVPNLIKDRINEKVSESQLDMFRFIQFEDVLQLDMPDTDWLIDKLIENLHASQSLVDYINKSINELHDLKNRCIDISKDNSNKLIIYERNV